MTAFLRFSQRKDISYLRPADPGPVGRRRQRLHPRHPAAGRRRLHLGGHAEPRCSTSASDSTTCSAAKSRRISAGPISRPNTASQACLPTLAGGFPRWSSAGFSNPTVGRQATNPQFQNPTSFNPKFNYSIVKGGHSIKFGYELLAIRTEVLDINPLYGQDTFAGHYSKPTAAQCGGCTVPTASAAIETYDLADFYLRPAQPDRPRQQSGHQSAPACALPLRAGRLARHSQTDSESRPALGIRHAHLGARQSMVEFQSRHQHARARHQRQPL